MIRSDDRARWNRKYETRVSGPVPPPNPRLVEWTRDLPSGTACDLAMGLGQNLQHFSNLRWKIIGVEISDLALLHARRWIRDPEGRIRLLQADLGRKILAPNSFDLVICTYFLERDLMPWIASLPRQGGRIFFETYDQAHTKYQPDFPQEYLLKTAEAQSFFRGFEILRFERFDTGRASFQSLLAARL